ncbi:hypothetical protein FXO38_05624 [Capsicum annuum]|nr:hypothetical protein FXO38_05624 [Capsicum annuum]KAF3676114.1 hypothetical protein FXO37_05475 [Capsicum annuum]
MGGRCSNLCFCLWPSNIKSHDIHASNIEKWTENEQLNLPAFKEYGLEELKVATSSFSIDNIVSEHGEKAANVVFKGRLNGNGLWIAIKRFQSSAWPDPRQFLVSIHFSCLVLLKFNNIFSSMIMSSTRPFTCGLEHQLRVRTNPVAFIHWIVDPATKTGYASGGQFVPHLRVDLILFYVPNA